MMSDILVPVVKKYGSVKPESDRPSWNIQSRRNLVELSSLDRRFDEVEHNDVKRKIPSA